MGVFMERARATRDLAFRLLTCLACGKNAVRNRSCTPSPQPASPPAHHLIQRRRVLLNMSRLTAAQVIALGEYLQPDFDPSTLTVPQLLGIFGFHNINYPSQHTKPKLVQLFKDEIAPKSSKFKKERLKRENSQASDDGITDGHTGRPLNEGRTVRSINSHNCLTSSHFRPPQPSGALLGDLLEHHLNLRSLSPHG